MKKIFILTLLIYLVVLTGLNSEVNFGERPEIDLNSVPDNAFYHNRIYIKFDRELTDHLDENPIIHTDNGTVLFNLQEIDELNLRYSVNKVNLLFESPALDNQFTERHRNWGFHLWYELFFPENQNVREIVNSYQKLNYVETAEPEFKKQLFGEVNFTETNPDLRWIPEDPQFENQWHYNNTGQANGTPGADIDLVSAWDIEKGDEAVIVAIIDSGIHINHADLAGNIWSGVGYNFVSNSPNIQAGDHGTHVAGTVAALSNNNVGVSGIAGGSGIGDGVRLMVCQVFSSTSSGGFHVAPVYAADNGASISQNSWGYTEQGVYNQNVLDAIDYFNENGGGEALEGGITIFAAGNSNSSGQWYPGYYSGAFSVASTNNQDIRAGYSNFGTWIDVSAPGGETSPLNAGGVLSTTTGGYAYYQGTSMACPHVSGVAALLISHAFGQLAADDVTVILRETTDDHYDVNPSFINMLGTGRLNANNALLEAINYIDSIANPQNFLASPADIDQIDLSWQRNNDQNDVMIVWSSSGEFGNPTEGTFYNVGESLPGGGTVLYAGNDSSYSHINLNSATTYFYRAFSFNEYFEYSPGRNATATTDAISLFFENFDSDNTLPDGWQIIDHLGNNQVWEIGTMSNGLSGTTGNYAHIYSLGHGIGSSQDSDLITPAINASAHSEVILSFTHSFNQFLNINLSTATLSYSIDNEDTWNVIQVWQSSTSNPTYFSVNLPELGGESEIRFKWNYQGSWGLHWCVDDVSVSGGGEPMFLPPLNLQAVIEAEQVNLFWDHPQGLRSRNLEGYNVYRNDNILNSTLWTETNYVDSDIQSGETYSYYVTAVYSEGESLPSNSVLVVIEDEFIPIPPHNLTAEVFDNNNFLLEWEISEPAANNRKSKHDNFISSKYSNLKRQRNQTLSGFRIYRNEELLSDMDSDTMIYKDLDLPDGTYIYYVTALYDDLESEPSNSVEVILTSAEDTSVEPYQTRLANNFPNPFNPDTYIEFSLAEEKFVTIEIYNISGQRISTLTDNKFSAGNHRVLWNGRDKNGNKSASGVYLYRMKAGEYDSTRKMIMIK